MTIALYARRKGWPVSGVTVRLRHSRIHADDCAECETAQGMLDRIESEITVAGDGDLALDPIEHALCGFTFGAGHARSDRERDHRRRRAYGAAARQATV